MDAACNVVYVDRGARQERLVRRGEVLTEASRSGGDAEAEEGARRLQVNVQTLLGTFNKVYVCPTGLSCLARIARLNSGPTKDLVPTLALIDIPEDDDENERKVPVPVLIQENVPLQEGDSDMGEVSSVRSVGDEPGAPNLYGSHLIRQITTDTKQGGVANMVLPVAVARRRVEISSSAPGTPTQTGPSSSSNQPPSPAVMQLPPDQASDMKYVDLGAVDVLENPIQRESLPSLAIHVYRVHKEFEQRGRHLTAPTQKHESPWPGVPTPYPFPYLREVMVSDLAGQICGTVVDHPLDPVVIDVRSEGHQQRIANAVGDWNFSAHDLNDDELLYATVRMLEHALQMDGMEEWRLPTDKLLNFVVASRNGYNDFVPYHNFRHVVDVLQAVFLLLVRIGALPPFPPHASIDTQPKSKLVKLLRPFEALTLLIAAIGHDIGHPGVNNMFLVKSGAPLASLYNDKSVLESYHAAVYCHMLKRLWPAVVDNEEMKVLLTSCILSTDMGIHNQYMEKLEKLQESMRNLSDDQEITKKDLETYRQVACNLLIKCADISNVARPFNCASMWTSILTEEFARQASMEKKIQLIPSTLFAPPATEIIGLAKSQTGFMSFYALPLFGGVADLMPTTRFCIEEIEKNKKEWEKKIDDEEARLKALRELAGEQQPQQQTRDREGSDDSVDNNNPPTAPVAEGSATRAATSTGSGGPSGGSGATSGGQSSSAPSGGQDSADVPPTLVRGQQAQSNSRPNSSSVTWDEASANSRPVTSSSARRVLDTSQVVTHRRSETTDGSASVPESGGWEGSARTGDSGKSGEKAECISTARTSVESAGMRGVNGVNGTKRKSLVNSVSTPDLRSDSKGRMRRGDSGGRDRDNHHQRKKVEKGDGSGVFASMRELSRRPSLGKFKFWKKREAGGFAGRENQIPPPMPNVMGRRGREGGVSVG